MQDFVACKVPFIAGAEPKLFLLKRKFRKTVLVMRITAILLLAATLQVSAKGWGQERINLSFTDAPLEQVFNAIKTQAGVSFFYRAQYVKGKNVTINVTNADLKTVLDLCLKNKELFYEIVGKTVVIHPVKEEKKTMSAGIIQAENSIYDKDLKGHVLTKDGEPLVSANIINKRTGKGTTTDAQGNFELQNVELNDIIIISYTGYEARSIKVSEFVILSIVMEPAVSQLDQVVMQAYGQTTQRFNTGNIAKVTSEEISKQPISNPLASLEGRVPGLVITQSNGVPGSSFTVQLRGQSSIGLTPGTVPTNNPLFIIDGVPFAPNNNSISTVSSAVGAAGRSPFNSINPADIESVEVLKDADATAIYGSRGANGAIIITTKKGRVGKTTVNASVYTGLSRVITPVKLLDTKQYVSVRKEAFSNDGVAMTTSNAPDLLLWDTTRYTDWQKMLIGNNATILDAQASVSGGNVTTQFLLGGGYHHETTVFPGNLNDNRASFHLNLSHVSPSHWFKANLSALYSTDKNNLISSDLTSNTFLAPNAPALLDGNGNLVWQENTVNFDNPLSYLKQSYTGLTNNLISNLLLTITPIKGLSIRSSFGYNTLSSNDKRIIPISAQNPIAAPTGYLSLGRIDYSSWIIEPQLEYTNSIAKGKITVFIGSTWQENVSSSINENGTGYTSDALINYLAAAPTVTINNNTKAEYHYTAFFGRLNYNYSDKYIINISGRRDGSSRFGPNNRFGNFGAIGGAWVFSNESFLRYASSVLSFGKIRASYGRTGNDQIGDYQYLDLWTILTGGNPYMGIPGIRPNRPFDPDFAWEINKKFEAAIELGILKDKIYLTASWYRNRSSNLLISAPLAAQTGFSSLGIQNFPGLVENTGLELSLATKNIANHTFSWSTSLVLTVPKNKLISFPDLATSNYKSSLVEGKPLAIQKMYAFDGLDPQTGLYKVKDLDNNGLFNTNDYIVVDKSPKYYGGISNTFKYKGWELTMFIEGRKQVGTNFLIPIFQRTPPGRYGNNAVGNQPVTILDRWKKPGDVAQFQKYTQAFSSAAYSAISNFTNSDISIVDASFLRLRTISLSYNFPGNWLTRFHLNGLKVYVNGQNLATITGYKGTDPETQSIYTLPPLKTWVGGIQLNF